MFHESEDEFVVERRHPSSFRVRRTAFTDPDVYRREQHQIWDRTWLYVGHTSEVPNNGDFVARNVAGRPVIMARGRDGTVRVLFNSCRHRGAEVCPHERGNSRSFTCPYHAWTYSNTGGLINIPSQEDFPADFPKDELGLMSPAQCDDYRGFVFVCFDPSTQPLSDYLAGAKEFIDLVVDASPAGVQIVEGTHRYGVHANWKLLSENGYDGYHLFPTHRTYLDFMRERGADTKAAGKRYEGSRALDLGNGHAVTARRQAMFPRLIARWNEVLPEEIRPRIEERRRELVGRLGEERALRVAEESFNMLIFPNLNILGGVTPVVRVLHPAGIDQIEVTGWCAGYVDDEPLERKMRLREFLSFWGPAGWATPDDVSILESCQRAYRASREVEWNDISKGMDREQPDNRDEEQMRVFWRQWQGLMNDSVEFVRPIPQEEAVTLASAGGAGQ